MPCGHIFRGKYILTFLCLFDLQAGAFQHPVEGFGDFRAGPFFAELHTVPSEGRGERVIPVPLQAVVTSVLAKMVFIHILKSTAITAELVKGISFHICHGLYEYGKIVVFPKELVLERILRDFLSRVPVYVSTHFPCAFQLVFPFVAFFVGLHDPLGLTGGRMAYPLFCFP